MATIRYPKLVPEIRDLHRTLKSSSVSGPTPPSPPRLVSSSTTSCAVHALRVPERLGRTARHPVSLSDLELYKLASETAQKIRWDSIVESAESGMAHWKPYETTRGFAIHVRYSANSFAVLATGTVPCSVRELETVLHAVNGRQHLQKMRAFHGDQFKDGALVYAVDQNDARLRDSISDRATVDDAVVTDVSVRTATFAKAHWLHRHDEWCYLDTVRRDQNGERFEKLMTSLPPNRLARGKSDSRTKFLRDVTSGIQLRPERSCIERPTLNNVMRPSSLQGKPVEHTRVHFYAEYSPQPSLLDHALGDETASHKTVHQRLLKMAQSCQRLTQLIHRRRLGVQVVIDPLRILPPAHTACVCCNIVLLLAKLCRVCGHGVCSDCSRKHEREIQVHGGTQSRLELVRVCGGCMARVDKADYTYVTDRSLMGPVVFPNGKSATGNATEILKQRLQDALESALFEEEKVAAMNVIRVALGQTLEADDAEVTKRTSSFSMRVLTPSPTPTLLTLSDSVHEYMIALDSLEVPQVAHHQAEIAASARRTYTIHPGNADDQGLAFPVPANEAERLCAIQATRLHDLTNLDVLNVICSLAARELNARVSLVTVITEHEQVVLGANVSSLAYARFPRAHAFCAHTIMDDKPLLVPHPEADVRFDQCDSLYEMDVRYYCGFPLFAADSKTVIGALCCMDTTSHDMTESQFAVLTKLAKTASRVLRLYGNHAPQRVSTARHSLHLYAHPV